eukprot:TRINITY_DN802_c0_g1_i1.p1 TRINITY_DN802_c0_g1~~TRINITY_DN802_c0_g1_i1.p1  ORF type:complete len:534 (-),score=162.97 TRINITY_DN802_c0_g1_i1:18-1619(-)
MRIGTFFFLCIFIICGLAVVTLPSEYESNYQFRFANSFRPPFFVIGGNSIPFFSFGGSTIATEEYFRLTPFVQSAIGYIWNKEKATMKDWEAFLEFQIHGGATGADGMAFWYVKDNNKPGTVFGNEDKWTGLAVMLDSFDNDNLGNNPRVTVIVNNGQKSYAKEADGAHQETAGCQYNFRGSVETIVMAVRYEHGILSISFGHKSESLNQFYKCIEDIYIGDLPESGYFGITAATGEVMDNHDIYSLNVYDLNPTYTPPVLDETPKPERPEVHDEDSLTDEEYESLRQTLAKEDAKNFTEPFMKLNKPKVFDEVIDELDEIEKKEEKPHHKTFDMHVDIPKESSIETGALSQESFDHVFQLVKLFQVQQTKMTNAFDAILTNLDDEKEVQTEQYATFAKSFRGIYENIIGRGDIKKLFKKVRELEHLNPKIDIISKVIDDIKNEIHPSKPSASHNNLRNLKNEIYQVRQQKDTHAQLLRSQINSLENQLSSLYNSLQEKKPSGSILIYVMAVQTILFFIYVIYFVFSIKKKRY